jgi:uncharacterized membrane protein YdjX (TVP38/TMEM64 family)
MNTQNSVNNKKRKIFLFLSAAILIAVFATATILLWKPFTDTFQNPERFRMWIDSHGIWGRLAFIGMAPLQVIFAVIPGEPLEVGAGYAFSALEGTVLCLLGDAVGTSIIFLLTKRLGIKLVEMFVSRKKIESLHFLHSSKNLNMLIFVLFFIPGTPKDMITYVIGLTPIKLSMFLILTSIARIPSILTSTMTGSALGVQNYKAAAIVYAVTGIISLAGVLTYRKLSGVLKRAKPKNPQDEL